MCSFSGYIPVTLQGSADDLSVTLHYLNITSSASTSTATEPSTSTIAISQPSTSTSSSPVLTTSTASVDSPSTMATGGSGKNDNTEKHKDPTSQGMSTAEKAGLGVGLCALFVSAAIGSIILFRRGRRTRSAKTIGAIELDGLEGRSKSRPMNSHVDMEQYFSPVELPAYGATQERAELE